MLIEIDQKDLFSLVNLRTVPSVVDMISVKISRLVEKRNHSVGETTIQIEPPDWFTSRMFCGK